MKQLSNQNSMGSSPRNPEETEVLIVLVPLGQAVPARDWPLVGERELEARRL